jgi:hypothetical protein
MTRSADLPSAEVDQLQLLTPIGWPEVTLEPTAALT